ncbi:hypothetical protein PROFUN_12879, partial [Planoprotostelium fungivorum]
DSLRDSLETRPSLQMAIRSRIPPILILTPPAFSLPKGKGFTKMGNLDSVCTRPLLSDGLQTIPFYYTIQL